MNGASDELWATTISAPKRNRLRTIGNSHQRFCLPKKPNSSPAVCRFLLVVRIHFIVVSWKVENNLLRFTVQGLMQRQGHNCESLRRLPNLSTPPEWS